MSHVVKLSLFLLLFLFLTASITSAAPNVVVIPMGNKPKVKRQQQLYIPAIMFRPLDPSTPWQYEADGGMINPGADTSIWMAPLVLPDGIKLISLELLWKNNGFWSVPGSCYVALHVFNELTAGSMVGLSTSSSENAIGIHKVSSTINMPMQEPIHLAIHVFLGHKDRWLMGVKVLYEE